MNDNASGRGCVFSAHCIGGVSPGVSLWPCTKNTVNNISSSCIKELTKLTFCSWMCLSLRTRTGKGPARGGRPWSCPVLWNHQIGLVMLVLCPFWKIHVSGSIITVEIRCQAFSNSWCPIWNFSTFEDFESSLADGVSFSSKYFGFFLSCL